MDVNSSGLIEEGETGIIVGVKLYLVGVLGLLDLLDWVLMKRREEKTGCLAGTKRIDQVGWVTLPSCSRASKSLVFRYPGMRTLWLQMEFYMVIVYIMV